jgi:hypothetical protein
VASTVVSILAAGVSLWAARVAQQQSAESLAVQRFQSVYERQLDFSELLANHSDVAAWIFGRADRRACRTPPNVSGLEARRDLVRQRRCAEQDAVLDYAVDFFNYVYWQVQAQLPSINEQADEIADANGGFVPLALRNGEDFDPPVPRDVSRDDWDEWSSWSETISNGFESKAMCDALKEAESAYDDWFVNAVQTTKCASYPGGPVMHVVAAALYYDEPARLVRAVFRTDLPVPRANAGAIGGVTIGRTTVRLRLVPGRNRCYAATFRAAGQPPAIGQTRVREGATYSVRFNPLGAFDILSLRLTRRSTRLCEFRPA